MTNKIQKLYAIGNAKWYNLFKSTWNWIVSKKAEKKLENFLKKNVNKSTEIVELGCGTALNLKKIKSLNLEFKHYTGLDFSEDMLKIARSKFKQSNVKFKYRDLNKLDVISNKVDVIICTWVLSHLPSPAEMVNQAQKSLKPNGKMFLIFLSEPKWYIRFWFAPFARYIFLSKWITNDQIGKIKNIISVNHFSSNITTVVEID